LETLQHQIVSEWARFADVAEQVITDTQRAAVRDIQDALGGNLNRVLTIARTEPDAGVSECQSAQLPG